MNGSDGHFINAWSAFVSVISIATESHYSSVSIVTFLYDNKALFKTLGALCSIFGVVIDFFDLYKKCGVTMAVKISTLLAILGFLAGNFTTFIFASVSNPFLGIALGIIVMGVIIPMILYEIKKLANDYAC